MSKIGDNQREEQPANVHEYRVLRPGFPLSPISGSQVLSAGSLAAPVAVRDHVRDRERSLPLSSLPLRDRVIGVAVEWQSMDIVNAMQGTITQFNTY